MGTLRECDVISIRKTEGAGKLRALVDIRIAGALVVRGCPVFEGVNGEFARLPRVIDRTGQWREVVIAVDDDLRKHYQQRIMGAFRSSREEQSESRETDQGKPRLQMQANEVPLHMKQKKEEGGVKVIRKGMTSAKVVRNTTKVNKEVDVDTPCRSGDGNERGARW